MTRARGTHTARTQNQERFDWRALYARLMTACGYTPNELDAMAMSDVLSLLHYWQTSPPTHEILAAVHQIARAAPHCLDAIDPSGIGSLIARFPDGHVKSS